MAGGGAFVGGLMGGPVGLVFGGILGTLFGYQATKDRLVSLPRAIEMLPYHRREMVANRVQSVIDSLDQQDLIHITQLAITVAVGGTRAVMQQEVLREILMAGTRYVQEQVVEEQRTNANFLNQ